MTITRTLLVAATAAPLALGIAAAPAHSPASPTRAVEHTAHVLTHTPGKNSTSDNWAGYVVHGADDSFTSVESVFTLPKVTCTSEGDTSFWVGFDGDPSSSVEQIGASGDCDGSTPDYYAWWEMYPAGVHELTNTTKPGDVFDARVTSSGGGKYVLFLNNETEGWTVTKNESSTSAEDNSAEVIFEAAGPTTDRVPTFSSVSMKDNTVNGQNLNTLSPEGIDLARNGKTLVKAGALTSSDTFPFTFEAAK